MRTPERRSRPGRGNRDSRDSRDARDARAGSSSLAIVRDRVADTLRPALADEGVDLEAVELRPAGRRRILRVVVDADGGVTLDRIADLSRSLAATLDSTDAMGPGAYTLEVTSRGVDRPLTEPRHWRRNVGRLVKVVGTDGRTTIGRISAYDGDGAQLDLGGTEEPAGTERVAYADIASARIQVEFNEQAARIDEADELEPDLDPDSDDDAEVR